MLKVLRENVKYLSWILWVIIAIFVIFIFVDFGSGIGGQRGSGRDNVAATVGHETISRLEFQRALANVQESYRQAYGEKFTPEMEKQMRLPLTVLNQLIQGRILSDEARRLGLSVSDEEVRQEILSKFKDEQGRFVGQEIYSRTLEMQHTTPDAFEREVRDGLLRQKLGQVLHAGLYVSDQEVEQSYRDQVERAKIRFVQAARGAGAPPAPTQADLAAYYDAHKDQWKRPEQRDIAYVLVENGRLQEKSQPDEKAVRSYYDSHQDEFKQDEQVHARQILVAVNDQRDDAAAKQRVEQAKKRIDGGEDFAKVAAELSDDASSKDRGGDLGFFGHNRNVKEFEDAAFGAPLGKLTGPVRSPLGYHLFQVLEKRPGGVRPFEEVRAQIASQLATERAKTAGEAKIKEIADRVERAKPKTVDDLRAAVKDFPDASFAVSPKFGQNDWVPGIGRQPVVGSTVFAMKKGEVSKPVQLPRGWAILFLKDVYPPHSQPLAEVEPRVRQELITEKLQQAALDRLNQAKQELAQGKSLDQVAAELGTKVEQSEEFGANGFIQGLGYNQPLAKAALALAPGQVGGPLPAAQGAVLFQVAEKKGFDPKQFAEQRDQIRQQLENDRLSRLMGSILEQRRRELGVAPDRQLLESYGIGGDENQPAG
jgi:peptidyl-prolyl cis-trans isomerase D